MSSVKPAIDSAISDEITFSFGENWSDYVANVSEDAIRSARSDIEEWLGASTVAGKNILDIGCGSGIHSLCYYQLGAKNIVSMDVDPKSVEATRVMWERAGRPENWRITHGSVLDPDFIGGLGQHDIVYSWGVLHHTGAMWEAIANASSRVARGGLFWIALYVKGPKYAEHLALKQKYNRASRLEKKIMVWKYIAGVMRDRRRAGLNPLKWNEKDGRGMDVYHDIIDWLGGLPYEVASKEEVVDFCGTRGFVLERVKENPEGGNNIYLFSLPA
ncbi:MAG TPA: class I SAM-dependent methyltransferase [Pyrinomonadaceae bacterium]|nr:class I SAM-dependent methyltransferase [Pyrinomonadaceae bacterium]